jgi:hypothetical protein
VSWGKRTSGVSDVICLFFLGGVSCNKFLTQYKISKHFRKCFRFSENAQKDLVFFRKIAMRF